MIEWTVDCLAHVFLMNHFGSSVKAVRKASTHLTEEPILLAIYIQSVYPKRVIRNLYTTPYLRCSLFRRHLRGIAFTSFPSVPLYFII